MVYKFVKELFDDLRLHVPIIDLLLFELVPCVPIGFHIILRQIFREAIRYEELLVLAELGEFVFLLDHLIFI